MIIIKNKEQAEFSIPRNADYSGLFVIKIYSPVGLWVKEYDVVDDTSSKNFYHFTASFLDLPDGEFNYTLKQDGEDVATGIMQIGDGETDDYYIQYPFSIEYEQYYPLLKSFITLETDEHLPESATSITYHVRTNSPWISQVFIRHHTQSEWSPWPPENHTEKNYYGTINIGPQVEDYPKHFKLVVTTKDGEASAEQEITQDAHYYFTVDVFSPYESLSWSATELSYGIQYSEYNSHHTGKFLIYRDGELFKEQPFGWYPQGFSTYTLIPQNETNSAVTYTITGVLDNEQSDTFVVTQEAQETSKGQRFTIEMLEDGDILWEGRGSEYYDIIRNGVRDEGYQLYHSVDGLLAGDVVEFYLRADNTNPINTPITSTAKHNVYGNIMSLLYVNFDDKKIVTAAQFKDLFYNDINLVDAGNLILPATTLETAAYADLFNGCTSLIGAPELPAKTLASDSYLNLFKNCSSLQHIRCLATDISSFGCTENWVSGVAANGVFEKDVTMTNWTTGKDGIPSGWTVWNYPDER